MLDTIGTAPVLPRRGNPGVNSKLDQIIDVTAHLTTDQITDEITRDGILGDPDTPSSGPVGRWILSMLQAEGVNAITYSWVGDLCVYTASLSLIGEVAIPSRHPLYDLECEVADLDRPELLWQGEGDPR